MALAFHRLQALRWVLDMWRNVRRADIHVTVQFACGVSLSLASVLAMLNIDTGRSGYTGT